MTKTKKKPKRNVLSIEMLLTREVLPWRCAVAGCGLWGPYFRLPNGKWSMRTGGKGFDDERRRCFFHGPFMGEVG